MSLAFTDLMRPAGILKGCFFQRSLRSMKLCGDRNLVSFEGNLLSGSIVTLFLLFVGDLLVYFARPYQSSELEIYFQGPWQGFRIRAVLTKF